MATKQRSIFSFIYLSPIVKQFMNLTSFMFLCYREDAFLLVGLPFLLLHLMVRRITLGKETMHISSLVWLLESYALVFITLRKSCFLLLRRYVSFLMYWHNIQSTQITYTNLIQISKYVCKSYHETSVQLYSSFYSICKLF